MSIEGISEGEVAIEFTGFECAEACEEREEVEKIDMLICSHARPNICTSFDQVKHIDSSRVVVILSDGSKWQVLREASETAFETISNSWLVGDDIRLEQYEDGEDDEFIMKNVREGSAYLTQLSQECDNVSKAYFLSRVDRSGYALCTGDGKLWVAGYWGSFDSQHWKDGDRVIINKGSHSSRYEDYNMINPRTMDEVWLTQVFAEESK